MTEREAWAEYITGPEWTGKPSDIWRKAVEWEREACAELLEQQHTWISNVAAANLVRERSNV